MPRTGDGRKNHPLYARWVSMNQRCRDANWSNFARYGGRGIRVHPSWEHDFWQFVADVGPRPTDERSPSGRSIWSLDRIDNDGNYEPGNVRWATNSEQNLNRAKPGPKPVPARCAHDHVYVPKYVTNSKTGKVSRYCTECFEEHRRTQAEKRRQRTGAQRRERSKY